MEKKVVSLEDRIPKLQQQRKHKTNRRLISFLSIFFLLILLVIYFQSPLSKVSRITVSGNNYVTSGEIIEMSGISKSTGFWNINSDNVKEKIEKHLQIKKVEIQKQVPNYIFLQVEEFESVAYLEKAGAYFPILENGQALQDQVVTTPADAPILINWKSNEEIEELVSELKKISPTITNSISEIHHTPGKTDPWLIKLYMNDGFEVIASVRTFSKKMESYPSIVNSLDENSRGVIHLEVGSYFRSYDQLNKEEEGNESEIEG
ncbi:FtsQ-type POTRA domain-containing protein [Metabacillus litoralis]|uniref:Cell division protein DivIB n=1 Tax=Metabacillus litoralis TaxID=152268 RepID=A0A5C6W2R9_9BACI|nr:FtsQ-type POTRA domain-containing protein [Metabacillus litoralis]TXC92048.1 FtsQ-type POTRA domain-containing protein [Metabacillus litoralis]